MPERARRPRPVTTNDTSPFWQAAARRELLLPRCRRCSTLFYPPPPRCPQCLRTELDWVQLTGRGVIVGWTTVHLATIPGIAPPFTVLEVELVEQVGLVISALLVSNPAATPEIGARVVIDFTDPDASHVAYPQFRLATGIAS